MNIKPIIPKRFEKKILLHIAKNNLLNDGSLILGIQGPPGEGKSYQLKEILNRNNIEYIHTTASFFSNDLEGVPKDRLIEKYKEASIRTRKMKQTTILIIDDFDTGITSIKTNAQYTVNTQILNGTLMDICDNPKHIGNNNSERIPIIITGNDFTYLYSPLIRHGRMDIFTWLPTKEEKIDIVSNFFPNLKISDIQKMINTFSEQPIAFYKQILISILEDIMWSKIEEEKCLNISSSFKFEEVKVNSINKIIEIGKTLLTTQQPGSFA